MPGRSTLTATGVPSGSSAKCTCATDALAIGIGVERSEHLVRPAGDTTRFSVASTCAIGERRHAVLQLRELVRDVGRQQVAPRRQHLAELDEDRAEALERQAQAHRARARQIAPERDAVDERPQPAHALVAEQELVETVALRHGQDAEQPRQAHGRDCSGRRRSSRGASRPVNAWLAIRERGVVRRRHVDGMRVRHQRAGSQERDDLVAAGHRVTIAEAA